MVGSEKNNSIVLRGVGEICGAVGVNKKKLPYYVNKHGLPAFKLPGCKEWLAVRGNLERWAIDQAKKHCGNA